MKSILNISKKIVKYLIKFIFKYKLDLKKNLLHMVQEDT